MRPPSGQIMAKQFVCLCLDAFMCSIKWSLHSSNGTLHQTHLQPWEEMRQEVEIGCESNGCPETSVFTLCFVKPAILCFYSLVSLALLIIFCYNMQISLFMSRPTTLPPL